jgi:thioredoxin-related protein
MFFRFPLSILIGASCFLSASPLAYTQTNAWRDILQLDSLWSQKDKPVLIVFGAEKCNYCIQQMAIVAYEKSLDSLLQLKFHLFYFDVFETRDFGFNGKWYVSSRELLIIEQHTFAEEMMANRATPTTIIFDTTGEMVYRSTNALNKQDWYELIDNE